MDNRTTFFRQAGSPPESTPELNIQIEQALQKITEIQTASTAHQHRMERLYQQAQSVEIQNAYSTHSFSQPAHNVYAFLPSAPPPDEPDNSYSYHR